VAGVADAGAVVAGVVVVVPAAPVPFATSPVGAVWPGAAVLLGVVAAALLGSPALLGEVAATSLPAVPALPEAGAAAGAELAVGSPDAAPDVGPVALPVVVGGAAAICTSAGGELGGSFSAHTGAPARITPSAALLAAILIVRKLIEPLALVHRPLNTRCLGERTPPCNESGGRDRTPPTATLQLLIRAFRRRRRHSARRCSCSSWCWCCSATR
jgi:hypothetical protein